jgi:hypothetical protein
VCKSGGARSTATSFISDFQITAEASIGMALARQRFSIRDASCGVSGRDQQTPRELLRRAAVYDVLCGYQERGVKHLDDGDGCYIPWPALFLWTESDADAPMHADRGDARDHRIHLGVRDDLSHR